ncbi:unnamed protein product [Peronospora destructor]|nr:unnamed protein product [Peronospora destructor]
MGDRFYYSGGSVREFTMTGCNDIIEAIDSATGRVDDASNLLSNKSSILTGGLQVDRLRHTFIKNRDDIDPRYSTETWDPFIYRSCWEHIIDSEYAARCLSLRLRSDALSQIYTWAKNTGNNSLTGGVFEILLHRLAADNQLDLYISEYDPPEKNKPKAPRHLEVKQVHLEKQSAICSGTATDYVANLTKWRDDETYSYWFPACRLFRNIDSIVKLKSTSGKKGNVAYLQFTVAARHAIDSEQLEEMNKIFFPDHVKSAGDTEPPIYIAQTKFQQREEICRVFVGYYTENKFGIAADGPRNDVLLKTLPPKSSHHLRKRSRLE